MFPVPNFIGVRGGVKYVGILRAYISVDNAISVKHNGDMNRMTAADRIRIVACLVEGNSIRATCRMTGASKGAVLKLLADMGGACERFHDRAVRDVHAERVQCDEIWAFCGAKDKNVPITKQGSRGVGSVWTWTALDADDKLMLTWHVGTRGPECAREFMLDLAGRLANRVQLTTDGHAAYPPAVREAFGKEIDYGTLVKMYRENRDTQARYSPCECIGTRKVPMIGAPLPSDTSTSHVERSNLTLRMQSRRFTRLTNAFSKKLDNLRAAVALHFVHYNFCRVHMSLKTTPAVRCGLADHVWTLAELVGLLEAEERALVGTDAMKRGPYRKAAISE